MITGRIEGEARGSGMTLDIRFVQLATLRNGLLMAWRFFRTREEALTALAAGSMRNADA